MADEHIDASGDAVKQVIDQNDTDKTSNPQNMPLDSSLRTEPIHPLITEVKLSLNVKSPAADATTVDATSSSNAPLTTLNPITLRPFTIDELRAHKLESLLSQYPTPDMAVKAREDTVAELRKLLDDNERKNKQIDHEMEEKEKTREIERKVYARKLGKDT